MVNVAVCATHNEKAYGRRFPDAMEFLFGRCKGGVFIKTTDDTHTLIDLQGY